MTILINRYNPFFDRKIAEDLYEENRHFLNNAYDFSYASDSDLFFNIYDKGEFIGCCYVMMEKHEGESLPFYSGYSKRKKHKEMIEAQHILLGLLFEHFDMVYTYTPHQHARLFNKKAGMIELKDHPGTFYMEKNKWVAAEKAEKQNCQQ